MNPSKMWAKFWISVKDWDESKLHSRRNYECVHDGELYRLFQNIFVLPFLRLVSYVKLCQSQWLRGLRCGYAAIRWLGLWVRIPQGAWLSVPYECFVLSGRGLCVWPITCPEESYRLWCV
jgi:hypothetical protein